MTALIVEDCELMRRLIKGLIDGVADAIVECESGEAAFAADAAHPPHRVLMDKHLPGVDGVAATGQIRAAFPDARILIVSDYGDERLRAAAREAGACGYVLKEDLLEIRRRLVAPCQTPNG